MTFTQVTVVGSWSLPGRGPLQGEVELAPTAVMRNAGEVAPGGVVAPLVDGAISVTLTATNDAGTTPSSVLYRVIERIPLLSQPPTYSYYIAVPAGAGTIDLRTVTRLQSIPAPERVTRDDLAVAIASIPGGGGGGAVSSVAGRTGTVTLTKTDVGLGSVDNTADTGKPVSAAQATALTAKLDKTSNLSDLASVSTARTNLGVAQATLDARYAPIAPVNIALTDSATIAVDATAGSRFKVTLGGNRTLGNPTGAVDGQILVLSIRQDGTGGRTLTLGSKYQLGSGVTVTLSTTAGVTDELAVRYSSDTDKFRVVGFQPGFA